MHIYLYSHSDQQPCKKPRITPGLDVFCGQCLHEEIESSGTKQNIECSICQRSTTIPEDGVNTLLSTMKPTEHICTQHHHDTEELTFFCETCQLLTCRECTLILHKDHRTADMCNISKVNRNAMREALVCAQEVTSKLTRAIDANDKMAEQIETTRKNVTLIITQRFEQLHQTIEDRKKTLLSEMEVLSLSKTAALAIQKEQLMKMQVEIGRYTEMTSHILHTHTDHEMIALGDLLPTELKAILKKVDDVFLTPNQTGDIHVFIHTDSLIKELSIFGHVLDSSPSPSQSAWSSESVAKTKKLYCANVESMTSKGERYPYGGLQVKAELRPKSHDGAGVPGEVEDHGDGTYTITLTPQTAGPHQLLITMDGQHVQNSPCDLDVKRCYTTLCKPEQVINCSGEPLGIAIHDSGDIYVTCGDNSIRVFDHTGQQKRTMGSFGWGDDQFNQPYGMFIKGDMIYVADYNNHRIQKLTTSGQFLQRYGRWGSGQGQLKYPTFVIVDQIDRLIVSDDNHRVVILDQAGTWLLTINGNVTDGYGFLNPYALALDPQGNIHVAADNCNAIYVFTLDGTYVRSYGNLKDPSGIVNDEEGYSLVNDFRGGCLSIFDPQGNKIHTVGNLRCPRDLGIQQLEEKNLARNQRKAMETAYVTELLAILPAKQKRSVEIASEKGASSWLNALPIARHGFANARAILARSLQVTADIDAINY
eukprot:Em0001g327a